MVPVTAALELPDWVPGRLRDVGAGLTDVEDRVRLVLDLASEHVERETGGPFAAAVFSLDDHELIAVGLNLVVPAMAPTAHAEIVAFTMAGQRLGNFDLSASGPTELVTSTEPCAMCLGAVHWSGVRRLVISARDEDARVAGFDEGHKPTDWLGFFERNGIGVQRDVLRSEGAAVLQRYADSGGTIYNAGAADA